MNNVPAHIRDSLHSIATSLANLWLWSHIVDGQNESPGGYLRLMMESDGDVIITAVEDNELDGEFRMASVQFCTSFGGGGASPKTHKALRNLMLAMAEDNRDSHEHRRHEFLGEEVIKRFAR